MLSSYYTENYYDIGEPFKISDVYKLLNSVSTVVDTKNVNVYPKFGVDYSSFEIQLEDLISQDGRYLDEVLEYTKLAFKNEDRV